MRVLCVDDEPMNRRVLRELLEAAGLSLTEAEDGEAGLAALEAARFDLILMDLRMPGMDGFEAIRRIRARGDDQATAPVILVTADTSEDLDDRALAAGANGVVRKPVDMHVLFDAIARAISDGPGAAVLS